MASFRPALTEAPQRQSAHWDRPVNSGPRPCLFDVGFPLSGLQDRTHTSDLNVRARHTSPKLDNGRARERKLTVGSGTVPIRAPRVKDKRVDVDTGERQRFSSKILRAYARRSPKVTDVLPVLYPRGLSTLSARRRARFAVGCLSG